MLSYQQALDHAIESATTVGTERISLADAAGRVLAAPIVADRDLPPFDRSERDGFAVRSDDFRDGLAELSISDEVIYAGCEPAHEIKPGECSRIMTGASLPPGADAVVPVEKSSVDGGRVVLNYSSIGAGIHIHGRGVDARSGAKLISPGAALDPPRLAVAYSVGAAEVEVYRKVRVTVFSTGDELVGVHETPRATQIRDCNGPGLRALINSMPWLECVQYSCIPDREAALEGAISAAMLETDALVMTGGVSMGDKDFVPGVLRKCGIDQILHKIAIRPGKPFWLGSALSHGHPLMAFGLPGNPMSVQVTFRELALPALRRMAGLEEIVPRALQIGIAESLSKSLPLGMFLQARLVTVEGETRAQPIAHHGSGDFVSAALADGVIVLPEGELELAPGDTVRFHLWRSA